PPIVLRNPPVRLHQPALLQAVEGLIQSRVADLQRPGGAPFQPAGDLEAMHRPPRERLQHQDVKRAFDQRQGVRHASSRVSIKSLKGRCAPRMGRARFLALTEGSRRVPCLTLRVPRPCLPERRRTWRERAPRETMAIKRMDNVGIVVEDLDSTIDFFTELGLELEGRGPIEGEWAEGVTGLRGMRVEVAMMR